MALASLSLPYKAAFLAKQTKYLMTKYPAASSPSRLFLLLINKPEQVRSAAMCGGLQIYIRAGGKDLRRR